MIAPEEGTLSLAAGMVLGAIGSIPLAGPISVLVFRRGLAARTAEARAVATGAALAEGIHAYLALWGLSWIAARWPYAFSVSQGVGAAVLILVGGWLWLRPIPAAVVPASDPITEPWARGLGRLLPSGRQGTATHLALGLGLTGANLSILLNWTAILGVLSRFGYRPLAGGDAMLFSLGVAIGIVAWFELALRVLARFRARLTDRILRWSTRAVAVVLLGLGGLGAFVLIR